MVNCRVLLPIDVDCGVFVYSLLSSRLRVDESFRSLLVGIDLHRRSSFLILVIRRSEMESRPTCQAILSQLNQYHGLTAMDDDEKVRKAMRDVFRLWPDLLTVAAQATEDELFELNISRAVISHVFGIAVKKESLQQDHQFIREVFFGGFELLSDHAETFRAVQSVFLASNVRLITKMITAIASSTQFKSSDFAREKDQQLLRAIREHVDNDDSQDELTDEIVSCIWNLSDRTMIVPILLKTGYASSVVEWVKRRAQKFHGDKADAPIHILHNLARHDDGTDQLNRFHSLEVIDAIQIKPSTDEETDDLAIHIVMIRALLSDASDIRSDASKYPTKIVDNLLKLAIDASKAKRFRHGGSHVSEPLTVLVKLFHSDKILHHALAKTDTEPTSLIELLASVLTRCYPNLTADPAVLENFTCVVILNLLRLISNHQRYRSTIADDEALMNVIKQAARDQVIFIDRFMPKTMESIQQAANNILNNLSH